MCGLVGVAGNIGITHEKLFRTLLVLDTLRGEDSTGVAVIHKDRGHPSSIVKGVGDPFALFDTNAFTRAFNKPNRVLIGHNRYATQGKVSRQNAHPFEYGDVIGAHNGTLNNKHVLLDGYKFDVDSQALLNHIDSRGLKDALDKLSGAWALTWWNAAENTINFIRNDQRPLYLCQTEDDKTIFWASEKWMLEVACHKHSIKVKEPFLLKQDTHVAVEVKQDGSFGETREEEVKSSIIPFQQATITHFPRQTPPQSSTVKPTQTGGQTTPTTLPGIENGGFAGSKSVKLVCEGTGQDTNGALFIFCKELTTNNSAGEIRLYIHKNDMKLVGQKIVADIAKGADYIPKKGLIYKVVYSSIRPLEEKKEEKVTEMEFVPDHKGNFISRDLWLRRYGTCSCCNDNVTPESNFKFLKSDTGTICGQCVNDPQLLSYLPAFHD